MQMIPVHNEDVFQVHRYIQRSSEYRCMKLYYTTWHFHQTDNMVMMNGIWTFSRNKYTSTVHISSSNWVEQYFCWSPKNPDPWKWWGHAPAIQVHSPLHWKVQTLVLRVSENPDTLFLRIMEFWDSCNYPSSHNHVFSWKMGVSPILGLPFI